MPDIRPFRGILYNPQKIGDFAQVVTEPYDVISPAQQLTYYKAHPCNIIRLILGKCYRGDTQKNNQYTRAKKYFADWLKQGILRRDKKAGVYIYSQNFSHHRRRITRTGFIVLLKLEDFAKNTVLPHENTFSEAVQDRLKLLQTTQANLCPIFALFCEPQGKTNRLLGQYKREHHPCIVIEKDRILHKIWRMNDKRRISSIRNLLKGRQIFIADGHHRYEAALNYKRQRQSRKRQFKGRAPFNYAMAYLVATNAPGLTILPIHRVVKIKGRLNLPRILQNLKKFFELHKFPASEDLFSYLGQRQGSARLFGVYLGKNKFYGLKLKAAKDICKFIGRKRRSLDKDLDVSILHSVIIEHIFKAVSPEKNICYTRDAQEAARLVQAGRYQAALFLQPATITQVKRVASRGEKMPHKSTYFYPKLLSGLIINKFNV